MVSTPLCEWKGPELQERFVPEKATETQHLVCQANESNDQINIHAAAAAAAAAAVCLLVLEADTQIVM